MLDKHEDETLTLKDLGLAPATRWDEVRVKQCGRVSVLFQVDLSGFRKTPELRFCQTHSVHQPGGKMGIFCI